MGGEQGIIIRLEVQSTLPRGSERRPIRYRCLPRNTVLRAVSPRAEPRVQFQAGESEGCFYSHG